MSENVVKTMEIIRVEKEKERREKVIIEKRHYEKREKPKKQAMVLSKGSKVAVTKALNLKHLRPRVLRQTVEPRSSRLVKVNLPSAGFKPISSREIDVLKLLWFLGPLSVNELKRVLSKIIEERDFNEILFNLKKRKLIKVTESGLIYLSEKGFLTCDNYREYSSAIDEIIEDYLPKVRLNVEKEIKLAIKPLSYSIVDFSGKKSLELRVPSITVEPYLTLSLSNLDYTKFEFQREELFGENIIPKISPLEPIQLSVQKFNTTPFVMKVKEKTAVGQIVSGEEPREVEDVLNELFPVLKPAKEGGWEFNIQRPLCLVARGETPDGLTMLEHIVSTKYTYHGEYRFSMKLPWQELPEIDKVMSEKTGVKHIPGSKIKREKPYELIISEDLIVRIPSFSEEDVPEIIRGLKEISKRGPKCVILYTPKSKVKFLEDLDKKVLDVDIVFVELPKYNEKTLRLIEKLLGIQLPSTMYEESIDRLWASAVRFYREELGKLKESLPTKGVDFYPERETELHHLMKRIVYYYLKEKGYTKVKAEKPEPLIDEYGRFAGYVIPDIIADNEYWEVETGYPTEEEKSLSRSLGAPMQGLYGSYRSTRIVQERYVLYFQLFMHIYFDMK